MKIMRFLAILLAGFVTSQVSAGEYLWLEGEAPSANPLHATVATPERNALLSGGKWINLSIPANEVPQKVPPEGALLGYDFDVKTAGHYEIWNRLGMNAIRSSFDWRIDNKEWQNIPVDAPYVDLMELGFWSQVAWVKLGNATLSVGKHMLQIRVMPTQTEKKGIARATGKDVVAKESLPVVYVADCFCLSLGAFHPHGNFKPDDPWITDDDRKAAAQIFDAKSGDTPGERTTTPLPGLWEVARWDEFEPVDRTHPDTVLPDVSQLFWTAIIVPGDKGKLRPDLTFAHRLVYRTHIAVPANNKRSAYVLHLPANNLMTSVFVNGQFCGGATTMLVPWDCDVSASIQPGATNEIEMVIKDVYYAFSTRKGPFSHTAYTPYEGVMRKLDNMWVGLSMDFPVANDPDSGILATPEFITCGSVYTADAFVRSSVQRKELSMDVTVTNATAQDVLAMVSVDVAPLAGGPVEKTFKPRAVTLSAHQGAVITFTESWENPKLWWPDDPQQYLATTMVRVEGIPVDAQHAKFGFREWNWSGNQILLNGIPWHGRSDATEGRSLAESLAIWQGHHQNLTTLLLGAPPKDTELEATLDAYDKAGIAVRLLDILNDEKLLYHCFGENDPVIFDRWKEHLVATAKAFRNHPSILVWSLGTSIAAAPDGGHVDKRSAAIAAAHDVNSAAKIDRVISDAATRVMACDPTRPVMMDGGRCLTTEEMPINGCQYEETEWRDYPDEAYTLERACLSDHFFEQLRLDRPIFIGKSINHFPMNNPQFLSQIGGDACGVCWQYAQSGAGLFARMISEGYRWYGISSVQFTHTQEQAGDYYASWSPVCALCRDWNVTFAGGTTVARTVKILNDSHCPDPINFSWKLSVDGKPVAGAQHTLAVPPGGAQELKIALPLPLVKTRTRGEWLLTCSRADKELFRDRKEIWVIDPDGGPKPVFNEGELAVLDPRGTVIARLTKRGIAFTELKPGVEIPATARVVVVGPDALDAHDAADAKWKDVAARGGRVLVLDQSQPLHLTALPVNLEIATCTGRVAFAESLQHPVFQGLALPDFFTWSGNHQVYRNVYRKGSSAIRSLVQCDEFLDYTALAECNVNDGLLVLCQLLVGTKLDTDPVAQRLFDNLLGYVAAYQPLSYKQVAQTFSRPDPRARLLSEAGVQSTNVDNALAAMRAGSAQIVMADATPVELKSLADNLGIVQPYLQNGGWLVLWGVTPEGLAMYNKLVGVDHIIRPFTCERVMLPEDRDPLLLGLTQHDLAMTTANDKNLHASYIPPFDYCSDSFSYVVDLEDVAPFLQIDWKKFNPGKDKPFCDHDPHNLVNGLFSWDSWRYIFQLPILQPELLEWDMTLPRAEVLTEFSVVPNGSYKKITGLTLTFDNQPQSTINLRIVPNNSKQTYPLPDCKAQTIHLKITDWADGSGPDLVGIDNLWFRARRSPEYFSKVKPLLNIGGLIKYPQGQGGIILCQIHVPEHEQASQNAGRKQKIISTLLRNLGAKLNP